MSSWRPVPGDGAGGRHASARACIRQWGSSPSPQAGDVRGRAAVVGGAAGGSASACAGGAGSCEGRAGAGLRPSWRRAKAAASELGQRNPHEAVGCRVGAGAHQKRAGSPS